MVHDDGIYVDGKKVPSSRGSEITPAMRIFQDRLNHKNAKGETVSLNAYLKWHVLRGEKLVSLNDLKDPAKSRKRGQSMTREEAEKFLAEIGLTPKTTSQA